MSSIHTALAPKDATRTPIAAVRQYFPQGTHLSRVSQAQLDRVSLCLNQRPRKTPGFQTPASGPQQSVASTS